MDVAAHVGEEEAVGLFLFGDGVVLRPELKEAVVEGVPVGGGVRARELAADRAVAVRQAAERRPAIGVEAVDVVERVDLAHQSGDVIVHVGREHAGLKELRLFFVVLRGAVGVAHGPLGMGGESIGPVEVGAHAGDDAHAALFGGGCAFAKEVAAVQEFSMLMERHL